MKPDRFWQFRRQLIQITSGVEFSDQQCEELISVLRARLFQPKKAQASQSTPPDQSKMDCHYCKNPMRHERFGESDLFTCDSCHVGYRRFDEFQQQHGSQPDPPGRLGGGEG